LIGFLASLIFCPFFADIILGSFCIFNSLVELTLQGGEEFFPVSYLLFFISVEFKLCVELVEKGGELGLGEGGFISNSISSLPLFEDFAGGVLVSGIGFNSFEEISRVFPKTNGLFAVGKLLRI